MPSLLCKVGTVLHLQYPVPGTSSRRTQYTFPVSVYSERWGAYSVEIEAAAATSRGAREGRSQEFPPRGTCPVAANAAQMRPRNETRRQRGGRAVLSGGVPGRITVGAVKRRPCQDIRGPQRLVSYQIPKANSEKELAVIRAIIAREQSIADLLKHVSTYGPRMVKNAGKAMNITNAV